MQYANSEGPESAQSDQGLRYPLEESLDIVEYIVKRTDTQIDCAEGQVDQGHRFLH